jgi:hypothetical protein
VEPAVIVNAVAYTAVDKTESKLLTATVINATGSAYLWNGIYSPTSNCGTIWFGLAKAVLSKAAFMVGGPVPNLVRILEYSLHIIRLPADVWLTHVYLVKM